MACSRGFRVALFTTCVVAGFAAPAQATTGGDTLVEATTFTVPGYSDGGAVATCPGGTRVVGGGVGSAADNLTGIPSSVEVSGPLDETGSTANTEDGDIARAWYASVANGNSFQDPAREYKVFALCSATSDATIEATAFHVDSDFPGDSQVGDGVATCPEGKRVVGGGLGTTAQYPSADLQLSGPLDETGSTLDTETGDIARSWYADVYNHNYPHNYKAFALCSATSDATVVATTFPMASDPVRGEVAGCPPGKRILGGGVGTTSDEVYDDLQVSGPLDSAGFTASTGDGDIARFWYGNVRNGPGARTYKIFALCGTDELLPLSAGSGGNGGGKVTSSPAGIDCPATCFTTFGYGEKITLKAKATLGSWFKGWSGDCSGTGQCVVSMKKGRSVTAIFAPSPSARKPLTVELAGDGSGRVTSTPEGIDCGSSCTRLYDKGTRVTLTADPAADSSFYGWSGGGCTGSGPCKVTVNADTTVTAYFPAGPPPHPPETKITDVSVSRTNRTAKFEFKSPHPSGESGDVSFECKLTGEAPRLEDWRPCSSPRAYDDLHQGEHVFSVRVTIDGTTDSTPAKEAFTI